MENPTSTTPKEDRDRTRQRRKQQKMIPTIVMAALSVILIGAAWYFIADPGSARSSADYNPEDVMFAQPIQAIHEMGGGSLDSIPFLPHDGPQPKVVLLEDFHNFGSVGPTEIVTHEFVILNQGDAPLTISRAYTTCGCTVADFTATVIPPGKVSIVTIRYDAGFHDARGQTVRRGIIIENNDPNNPQVELWAQAAVRNQ